MWCCSILCRLHKEAVSKLVNLRVCEMVQVTGGQAIQLQSYFKTNLRVLLCGGLV